MKIVPGQYWRCLVEPEDSYSVPKGGLILITEIDEDGINFAHHDSH